VGGGKLWYSHMFLQFIKYIILEFTPPPIPEVISTGNSFIKENDQEKAFQLKWKL
jgi:hypothetical protein